MDKPTAESSQAKDPAKLANNIASKVVRNGKVVLPRQCYVEEQAKPRDSFMVDAYKILKSLMKSMRRLIVHLGTDEEQASQA